MPGSVTPQQPSRELAFATLAALLEEKAVDKWPTCAFELPMLGKPDIGRNEPLNVARAPVIGPDERTFRFRPRRRSGQEHHDGARSRPGTVLASFDTQSCIGAAHGTSETCAITGGKAGLKARIIDSPG